MVNNFNSILFPSMGQTVDLKNIDMMRWLHRLKLKMEDFKKLLLLLLFSV